MLERALAHLAVLMALLFCSAFFSAVETAFFSLNLLRVRHLQSRGGRRGALVAKLILRPKELIVTILMGNELVNIAASSLVGAYLMELFGANGKWYAIVIMALLILTFGEITPKTLAVTYPQAFAVGLAPLIGAFSWLTAWPNRIIQMLTHGLVAALGGDREVNVITEEEFKGLVREGRKIGVLDRDEEDIIFNILDMGDLTVASLMVPRTELLALEETATVNEALDAFRDSRFSRIPVYRGDLDHISGILFLKDILLAKAQGKLTGRETAARLAKQPLVVPETMRADELFMEIKKNRVHMAVVVDEYGGTAGVITLENLLRHLYESAAASSAEREFIQRLDDGTAVISGKLSIEEFNRLLGGAFRHDDYNTIGGMLLHLFGRLPARGDVLSAAGFRFRVLSVEEQRIAIIRVEHARRREAS